MKRILFATIVTAAVLCSCSKEDVLNTDSKSDSKVFTCIIENDDATRTTISDRNVLWEGSDTIYINGSAYKISSMTADKNSATFELISGQTEPSSINGYYYAFYNGCNGNGGWNSEQYSYVLPASYTYTSGKFRMPMCARATSTSLSFKNFCGVLELKINRDCGLTKVNTITVVSNLALNGPFNIKSDEGIITFIEGQTTSQTVINCKNKDMDPETLMSFYIPIPEGTHNLTITAADKSGNSAVLTTKSGGVTLYKNNIYTMDENTNWKINRGGDPSSAI